MKWVYHLININTPIYYSFVKSYHKKVNNHHQITPNLYQNKNYNHLI